MTQVGAVDIGGTKIAVGVVDQDGHILAQEVVPTDPHSSFAGGMDQVESLLRACLERVPDPSLAGIGIGCTGQFDSAGRILKPNAFLPGWTGGNLAEALSARLGVPAAIENDADAAALAEARWGAGTGASTSLYLTVSTGIGGGLVINGRLYRGVGGAHPELGHHVIDPSGPPCFCGASGCWERLASGSALADWYRVHSPDGLKTTAREVCLRAVQGDPQARAAVEREGLYLGLGLANLITLFAPDCIVLGGGVMESWELFEAQVRQIIQQNCGLVPADQVALRRASLGARTGLAGAGAVWFQEK